MSNLNSILIVNKAMEQPNEVTHLTNCKRNDSAAMETSCEYQRVIAWENGPESNSWMPKPENQ